MIYAYKKLGKPEDWREIVGEKNWVPKHSAYELAYKWGYNAFPKKVQGVLTASASPFQTGLKLDHMVVEKPVFLDNLKAPSMTDIMVYCNTQSGSPLIIAVEGKARETFDLSVADWMLDKTMGPKPTREKRLKFLEKELGVTIPPDSELRYQLIHRSASALIESGLHGAASCALIVHSFAEDSKSNWQDYGAFLKHIGIADPVKDVLQGPVTLGPQGIHFYAAWITDEPKKDADTAPTPAV